MTVLGMLVAALSTGVPLPAHALPSAVDGDRDGELDGLEMHLGSDPAAAASTPESVAAPPTCLDGLDNDADGQADLDDPGCAPPTVSDETFPGAGLDAFDSRLTLEAYPLVTTFGTCPVDFAARGPTVVQRGAPQELGGGRRAIDVEIVALQLRGMATILADPSCSIPPGSYPITMFEDPAQASLGRVTDTNDDPARDFPADSFFDVFFQIETPAGVLPGSPPNGPPGDPVRVENSFDTIPPYQTARNPSCYQVPGLTHEHCPKAPPDHYKCYEGKFPRFQRRSVTLEDQFSRKDARVVQPLLFCNPAAKDAEPLYDEAGHLECYAIKSEKEKPAPVVVVRNQYGQEMVKVKKPAMLCLPSRKNDLPDPTTLDHYKCYRGKFPRFAGRAVTLFDQFGSEQTQVMKPVFLCNPVSKNGEPIQDRLNHLKCYALRPKRTRQTVTVTNQFGTKTVKLGRSKLLCVPSAKFLGGTTTTTTVPTPTTTTTLPTGGRAVTLAVTTGPFEQGSVICLARVTGPQACVAQPDVCPGVHLHRQILIDGMGPFLDPNMPACGHGQISTQPSCGPDTVPNCG
jgi:hypothetical protein